MNNLKIILFVIILVNFNKKRFVSSLNSSLEVGSPLTKLDLRILFKIESILSLFLISS